MTANGRAMGQIATTTDTVAGNVEYVFELMNPDAGSNTIVISTGAASYIAGLAASYTGAAQSGQPDNTATNNDPTNTDTFATALTPHADNCWITLLKQAGQLAASYLGCVERVVGTDGRIAWADTNGPVTPPASTTLTFTTTFFGTQHTAILASLAPPSTIQPKPFFTTMTSSPRRAA